MVKMFGRMNDVLYTVYQYRGRLTAYVEHPLQPQHILAVTVQQHAHPYAKSRPIQGLIELQAE
jgi:hypothetical protein